MNKAQFKQACTEAFGDSVVTFEEEPYFYWAKYLNVVFAVWISDEGAADCVSRFGESCWKSLDTDSIEKFKKSIKDVVDAYKETLSPYRDGKDDSDMHEKENKHSKSDKNLIIGINKYFELTKQNLPGDKGEEFLKIHNWLTELLVSRRLIRYYRENKNKDELVNNRKKD